MDDVKISLIIGFIFLIVAFLVDYFFVLKPKFKMIVGKKKNKKNKNIQISELQLMKARHNIDMDKLNLKNVIIVIAIINAFIMAFTATVLMLIPLAMIWQLLIGFVVLMALIYALYELYARYLERKGSEK